MTASRRIKVIHVHFIHGRKNYYFGSVSAIYRKFTDRDIGIGESSLRHCLSADGNHYINDEVVVIRSRLLR